MKINKHNAAMLTVIMLTTGVLFSGVVDVDAASVSLKSSDLKNTGILVDSNDDSYHENNAENQLGDLKIGNNDTVTLKPGNYRFSNIDDYGHLTTLNHDEDGNNTIDTYITASQIRVDGDKAQLDLNNTSMTGNIEVVDSGSFNSKNSSITGNMTVANKLVNQSYANIENTSLTGNIMIANGGSFHGTDSLISGNVIVDNGVLSYEKGTIHGNVNADNTGYVTFIGSTITNDDKSAVVSISNTNGGDLIDNVLVEGTLKLDNSQIELSTDSSLTAKNIIITGNGGVTINPYEEPDLYTGIIKTNDLTFGNSSSSSASAHIDTKLKVGRNTTVQGAMQASVTNGGSLGNINLASKGSRLYLYGATGKEVYTANRITSKTKGQLQVWSGIFSAPDLRNMTKKAADGTIVLDYRGVLRTTTGQLFAKGINTSSDKKAKDSTGAGKVTNKKVSFKDGTVQFTDSKYGEKYLTSARSAMQGTNAWYTMSGKYVDGKSIDVANAAKNNKVLRDKVTVNSKKKNILVGYRSQDAPTFSDSGIKIDKKKADFAENGFRASKLNLGKSSDGMVITDGQIVTLGGSTNGDLITVDNKKTAIKIDVGVSKKISKAKGRVTEGYLSLGDDAVGHGKKYKLNASVTVNKGSRLHAESGTTYINSIENKGIVDIENGAEIDTPVLSGSDNFTVHNEGTLKAQNFYINTRKGSTITDVGVTTIGNLKLQDHGWLQVKDGAHLNVSNFDIGDYASLELKNSYINIANLDFTQGSLNSHNSAINSNINMGNGEANLANTTVNGNVNVENGGATLENTKVNGDVNVENGSAVLNNTAVYGHVNVGSGSAILQGATIQNDITAGANSHLSFDNDVTVQKSITSNGSVDVNSGALNVNSLTMSGDNNSLSLGKNTSISGQEINLADGGELYADHATINDEIIHLQRTNNNYGYLELRDTNLNNSSIIDEGGYGYITNGTYRLNNLISTDGTITLQNARIYLNKNAAIGGTNEGKIYLENGSLLKDDYLWDDTHRSVLVDGKEIAPDDCSIYIGDQAHVVTPFNQIFTDDGQVNTKFNYTSGIFVLTGDYTEENLDTAYNKAQSGSKFIFDGEYTDAASDTMTLSEAAGFPNFLFSDITVQADDGILDQSFSASHVDIGNQSDLNVQSGASVFLASDGQDNVLSRDNVNVHVGKDDDSDTDNSTLTLGDSYYGKNGQYKFGDVNIAKSGTVQLNPGTYQFSKITNKGSLYINNTYSAENNDRRATSISAAKVVTSGEAADFMLNDAELQSDVIIENEGSFEGVNNKITGQITIRNQGTFQDENSVIYGDVNTDDAGLIYLRNVQIEKNSDQNQVTFKNTDGIEMEGNVDIASNLNIENSSVYMDSGATLTAQNITVNGTSLLYGYDPSADIYSRFSKVKANSISVNTGIVYSNVLSMALHEAELNGSEGLNYRLKIDNNSQTSIDVLTLKNGNVRVSNGAQLDIGPRSDHGIISTIDNSKNSGAKILADGGIINENNVKVTNTDLIARSKDWLPGSINHFNGSISNDQIIAIGQGSSIALNGEAGVQTVFSPKKNLQASDGAKIYIKGGILKSDSLRNLAAKSDKKGIQLSDEGVIQTRTGQLFSKGINTLSKAKAQASSGAGVITNDKVDLRAGTVLFDDARYGEKYLASAAKTMDKTGKVWFTMSGEYVDGKSISPTTAMKNDRVLRNKVTVNSKKKNMVVGVDPKKKSTFTENGVKINKNNSEFVTNGFRASKLNLASGSNGLVITGGKTLTLGGSQNGSILTAGNKDAKWNIVVGTVANHLGKSGKTTGRLVLGDAAVGSKAENSISGSVLINKKSTLEQIGNYMSLDTINNKGKVYVHKSGNMDAKNLRMYDGSTFEGGGLTYFHKVTIMPGSDQVKFKGFYNMYANEMIVNNNQDAYFGNRLNVDNMHGNQGSIVFTNGATVSIDNLKWKDGYIELQGADPEELINAKSASVSINNSTSLDNTELHVYPNSELKFGNNAKVTLENGGHVEAEPYSTVSFGPWSEVHVSADSDRKVQNVIKVNKGGTNAQINIDDNSKLVVSNAVADGSAYDLSNVVTGSDVMWKQIFGNDTEFIEGTEVDDDLHYYTFGVISPAKIQRRFAKLMTANTVAAVLTDTASANTINSTSLAKSENTNRTDNNAGSTGSAEKAGDFVVSVSHPGTPAAQTVSSLNHLAGLNGLGMVKRGLYSFGSTIGDSVADHQSDDSDIWAGFLHHDENSSGIKVGNLHDGYKLNYHGAIVGYDFHKNDSSRTGVVAAYADGNSYTKGDGSTKNDMKYYAGGLYHMIDHGMSRFTFDVDYIHSANDLTQWNAGQQITASTHGDGIMAGIRFDSKYQIGHSTWSPFAGLRYMHLESDDFMDSLGFRHESENIDTWKLPIGLAYEYTRDAGHWQLTPRVEVGYSLAMGDKGYKDSLGFGSGIDTFDVDVAENSWFVRPSVSFSKDDLTLEAYYKYEKGNDIISKNWGIQVGYKF
ncbi:MAG: autotransporter domain-containing protein [Megasphaera elsdenii]|nr:autotransporter domain-containing protein [Megasphaera elsdenii]